MKVAVLGYGTVGSGVVDILKTKKDVEIKYVYNRFNLTKKQRLGDLFTDDINQILNDEEVKIIIETMGGMDPYEIIKEALNRHKHVITANKEIVASKLDELVFLARKNNVMFLFEASVGGGMPIVRNLCEVVLSDEVTHIYGILNGTTNFMIQRISENETFFSALKEAQYHGYAEIDPTADLEGLDMVRKIAILTMLVTNSHVNTDEVYHYGINNLTREFITFLLEKGLVVKFIAEAIIKEQSLQLVVEPVVCDKKHWLANINSVMNGVIVETKNHQKLFYAGIGAGKMPTAAAIVDDLYMLVNNRNYISYQNKNKFINYQDDSLNDYYVNDGNSFILKRKISRNDAKKYHFYARMI